MTASGRGRTTTTAGPRYNTNYIQCVGIGTITDSLSAIKKHVFEDRTFTMDRLLKALRNNFKDEEAAAADACEQDARLRQR